MRYLLVLLLLTGCLTPSKKYHKAEQKVERSEKAIDTAKDERVEKGKAYVYGTRLSLDRVPKSPESDLSIRLIDLASLTLGPPKLEDARQMREIISGLTQAEQKLKDQAEAQLSEFNASVDLLEAKAETLKKVYDKEVIKLEKISTVNADKADKWDVENSFVNQWNPFRTFWKLCKQLMVLGAIGGVLYFGFIILETFFPQLSIVSAIGGWIGSLVFKLTPKAKTFAGVVSHSVATGFKQTVKAIDDFKGRLSEIKDPTAIFADNATFTKSHVQSFLEAQKQEIMVLLKAELSEHQDDHSRALVDRMQDTPVAKSGAPL